MMATTVLPKILAFSDWYLPGRNGGGAVTALANQVELLGDEFAFYVFTRDRDLTDRRPYSGVPRDRWVTVGRAQVLYTSDLSFGNLRRRIREVAPDVIYLGSFFSRLTVKTLLLRRLGLLPACAVLLAPRGEFGPGALGLKRLRKWVYLNVAMRTGLCRGMLWHASSGLEEQHIRREILANGERGNANVRVACTIPGSSLFQRGESIAKPEKRSGRARFLFLSRIARNKNLGFALELFASCSGWVDFDIYGPIDDAAYWKECLGQMQTLTRGVRANYFGQIPYEAVPSTVAARDFFLLPTLGENFGYVILEALSAGCPVLISDQTPWRNLQALGIGWDIPLSEGERWRAAVRECVEMEPERYRAMSERARSFAREWASSIAFRQEHVQLFCHTPDCCPDWERHARPEESEEAAG
jgi:glycosyltransferase involved in cell wall biosynthesis